MTTRLLIVSDTPHHLSPGGETLGFGPAVREYDQLSSLFDEVVHLAPRHDGPAPANARPYSSDRICLRPIAPAGGDGVVAKLGVARRIPGWARAIATESRDADAVHVRCPANVCLIALLVLATRRRPRIRWVQYAVDWSGTRGEALSYRLQRWLLRHDVCRAEVTVNGAWPHQPHHVHSFDNPALTDDEVLAAQEAAERKPAPDPVRLLFAGRFAPSKAPLRALAVATELRDRGVRFHLDLAGDGTERGACETFVTDHSLDELVTFHGWLDRPSLDALYAGTHVVLLPSIGEGFPRAVVEAMAFGAVPASGDCSCVRQVLTEVGAGAALAPYDIAAFADYITDLVTTERWHVESTAAVAAAPRFTYARHIDGIRELLSQTARRRDLASDAAVKVLILAPGVPPPMGGSERMAAELHRHLRQLCDVHLVSTSERVPTIADASIVRRPRSRVGGLLSPARFGGAVGRQLLAHDVDVVHALTWRAAVPLLCIPRSRRPPLVVHCLGAELLRAPGLEWLRHRVLTEADALLAISQHTAEVAHSLCARMPTVVPPGVDLDRFAAIARADAPSDSTALRVVSVGRLELRKRHGELIQAVKELSDSGVDCRLTIVGEGSEAANLAALIADLACGDRVEIVRGADEVRLLAELRRADVFALLARDAADDIEGFGIAYVEAAASGLPIVAGDAPGVLDAVQSGINAVITRSRRDVVEALRQLAANECARAEMSAAGVAFARRFAWPEVAGRLVAEYAALGAARRGSGLSDQRPDGRDQHA